MRFMIMREDDGGSAVTSSVPHKHTSLVVMAHTQVFPLSRSTMDCISLKHRIHHNKLNKSNKRDHRFPHQVKKNNWDCKMQCITPCKRNLISPKGELPTDHGRRQTKHITLAALRNWVSAFYQLWLAARWVCFRAAHRMAKQAGSGKREEARKEGA